MLPLLTIPLPCFHGSMVKCIQSQAAIIIYKKSNVLSTSGLSNHIYPADHCQIIFQKSSCELAVSSALGK